MFFLLSASAKAQESNFFFYGDTLNLPGCSLAEKDSLLRGGAVPQRIKSYLNDRMKIMNLSSWGLVYFLKDLVDAQFDRDSNIEKVRILNRLLTEEHINNAIGIISKSRVECFVSVDSKAKMVNMRYIPYDGYKLVTIKNELMQHIKNVDITASADYKDVDLDYSSVPLFRNLNPRQKKVQFYNYCLGSQDSLTFSFSQSYNQYFGDLPRIVPDYHYYKAPLSPTFKTSFFRELNGKISCCTTRIDSINFLIKLIQTGVQFEEDIVTYGQEDFCSFPENTIAIGKGDCEDKCEAFALLIDHYFPTFDIVFLFYPNHVRIGLWDSLLSLKDKPYQEIEGRKYLEVELQSNDTVLADDVFAQFPQTPISYRR